MNFFWGGWEHKHSVHNTGSVSVGSEAMTVQEGEQVSWKGQKVWSESGILRLKILDVGSR